MDTVADPSISAHAGRPIITPSGAVGRVSGLDHSQVTRRNTVRWANACKKAKAAVKGALISVDGRRGVSKNKNFPYCI